MASYSVRQNIARSRGNRILEQINRGGQKPRWCMDYRRHVSGKFIGNNDFLGVRYFLDCKLIFIFFI